MGSWPDPEKIPAEKYQSNLKGEYPAYFISWYDCHKLAEKLTEYVSETGQGNYEFRLPTEAEWEYACRAGTTGKFYFSETEADKYMWYEDEASQLKGVKPVGLKLPNQWGLYDMTGNVWEWCEDWYHDSYEGAPTDGSAWIEPKGEYVILHGGDWDLSAGPCRCPNRNDHRKPADRDPDIGARLVCTLKGQWPPKKQGLVGGWYRSPDLTRVGASKALKKLDMDINPLTGHGNDFSAQWVGYITAPATGKVTYTGKCNKDFEIEIDGKKVVDIKNMAETSSGSVEMVKGQKYPIHVKYMQVSPGRAYFKVFWEWAGQEKKIVDRDALSYTKEQAQYWNFTEKPNPETFDLSTINAIPVENHLVYYKPGRFGGWPANNGVWSWGNEILVGFSLGYHDPDTTGGHAIDGDKPDVNVLARSLDGGKTWTVEDPDNFVGDPVDRKNKIKECPGLNFTHPDFALRIKDERLFVSYDRGKNWQGPYRINVTGKDVGELTSRTDYIVVGPKECMVFMSAKTGVVQSYYQDRSFCTRTTDGGKSFEFLGWMTHNTEIRSVMNSSVYVGENHLVSVMRRLHEKPFEGRPSIINNWIEAAESKDNGKTWTSLGKVANTDLGDNNGNPPSMVKLPDGRLCVAYGYRDYPYGIRIKVSSDKGKSWGQEIVLRSDGGTWDLGYTRIVVRPDGKVAVMYYYNTKERQSQHIGVTIWDPADVK
jgi:hypothetical protein